MRKTIFRRALHNVLTALILAALVSATGIARASADKKPAPAQAPRPSTPAPRPAPPAARPAGNPGGGNMQRPTPNMPSVNRPTTNMPSANRPTTNMPSANMPSANRPTTNMPSANMPSANRPTTNMPAGNGGGARPGSTAMPAAGGGRPGVNTQFGGGHPTMPNNSGPHNNMVPHNTAIRTPPSRGSNEHVANSGNAVRTRANGRPSDVHDARRGMDVHHGLNGNRRVAVERPGHGRLVAERGRPGFVQRGYSYHGHDFGRRAYYYHGHEYNRYYRGYGYRGLYLNVYAPGMYYGPAFYGWAYAPWGAPISYGWGFAGNPWYGYYGYYFSPYPSYPSASYWLTDYMISSDLQTAYAAHAEAGEADGAPPAGDGGQPMLTADVKQQIADEVRNQLALENQEAQQTTQQQDVDPGSSGIARVLSDAARGRTHVFVVGATLDVVDASQTECALSDGDVLALQIAPAADATSVDLVVLSSKGGQECQKQATVSVSLDDLQEMQNHMRETIDRGLQELQAKQGKGGLPQLPPSAQTKPVQPEYAEIAPPPDPKDAADLQQQAQQADQAESEVSSEVGLQAGAPYSPSTVAPGQSFADVEGILGQPTSKAMLGSKVIYNYDGKKVIFRDGKVADVQ